MAAVGGAVSADRTRADAAGEGEAERQHDGNGPLLLIFAHPDDEAFGCAGVMAAAAERGVSVTLISATRGEAGKTGIPELDTPEILGAVREQELRAAAAAVDAVDVRFLDYRDSGMAGTPENDDPRAFSKATEANVVDRLVVHLRAVRPATVITFGPEGIYGHPDHLMAHRTAVAAVHAAADPAVLPAVGPPWRARALYFTAVPRERMLAMIDRPDGPLQDLEPGQRDKVGTPSAEITTVVDISPYVEIKTQAIAAHRTQVGDGGPLAGMPPEQRELMLSREQFVRAPLPWDDPVAPAVDLVAALAAATPLASA
jgi:LmbE family N-acetylglucosaminyl deacetylase